jgi:hypothetical protein
MGMYDESWCAGCGAGMHYTENESAQCDNCWSSEFDSLKQWLTTRIDELKEEITSYGLWEQSHVSYLEGLQEAYEVVLGKVA